MVRIAKTVAQVLVVVSGCGGGQQMTQTATGSTGSTGSDTFVTSLTEAMPTEGPAPVVWETQLEVGEEVGAFFGVWGPTADDMIVVGGQIDAGVIYRNRSGSWQPDVVDGVGRLNWVYGVDGYTVVVGYGGTALHLDEGVWVADPTPTTARLWGVWGPAADDLWAVGGNTGDAEPPVLLHWQGTSWEQVAFDLETDARALFKVWGTASDDIFAVGDRGLVTHFDGVQWTLQDSGTQSSIIGVWGRASDDVVISGGRSSGIVVRNGSGKWSGRRFSDREGFDGAWMDSDGVTTVVGRRGFIGRFMPKSLDPAIEVSGTEVELHGVFGLPDGRIFAVGGLFDAPPYTAGLILMRPPA